MKIKMKKSVMFMISALVAVTGAWGLEFAFVPTAQAACTYGITRMDAESTILKTGTLHMNTTVTRSGTAGECADSVTMVYLVTAEYDMPVSGSTPTHETNLELTRRDVNFNGAASQSFTVDYPLSQLDWKKIPNQNQLQLFAWMIQGSTNVKTSSIWNISVTGGSSGTTPTGARSITLSFDRATYNKDDKLTTVIKLNNAAGAPDVDIVTSVNGQVVGSFLKTGSTLANSQTQDITVTAANAFKNGSNTITVRMYNQNTNRSLLFAQGESQVAIAGFPADTGTGTGGTTGGGTTGGGTTGGGTTGGTTPTVNSVDCAKDPTNQNCLYNPLVTNSLVDMFLFLAKAFLGVLGILAVIFIIIGGFRMVMSQGNEEAYTQAKNTIIWAILGIVVAVLSFSIIAIVQDLLQADVKNVIETQK